MSARHLAVVAPSEARGSPAERLERLQLEARTIAREQLEALSAALAQVSQLAAEVGAGGDLYPVGARELARRLTDDADKQVSALSAIIERR